MWVEGGFDALCPTRADGAVRHDPRVFEYKIILFFLFLFNFCLNVVSKQICVLYKDC